MATTVDNIFSKIYKYYDVMNTILSFGVDSKWRDACVSEAMLMPRNCSLLDVATGTGELAIKIAKAAEKRRISVSIDAVDTNRMMLALAVKKAKKAKVENIRFRRGNALSLPYRSRTFDVVTCSFALRDFDDLTQFLYEVRRVLKPHGRFVFIDMAMPNNPYSKLFFSIYAYLMRLIGALVARGAYKWLVESIRGFDKRALLKLIKSEGFRNVKIANLATGIAFIVVGAR